MARTDTLGNFLTDVANAIRTKSGTSGQIQASSFDTAIANLPGGGAVEVEENDVNFYDYDGTRLHSYTKTDFLALESMPENPTHDGLTSQGWSYTLAEAKNFVTKLGKLTIGQYFVTSDGATKIYFELAGDERLTPYLCFAVNGTATINWGDNTTTTITSDSLTTATRTPHTYASKGKYTISISGDEIAFLSPTRSTDSSQILMLDNVTLENYFDSVYSTSIYKIELGTNITGIDSYVFNKLTNLESITTPLNITTLTGNYHFSQCLKLKFYLLPKVSAIPNYFMQNCFSLDNIAFSSTTNASNMYAFSGCSNLKRVILAGINVSSNMFFGCSGLKEVLNDNSTTFSSSIFTNCYSLTEFVFPTTTYRIRSGVFSNCKSLKKLDFTKMTYVPTLDNVNFISGVPSDCKIVVPNDLYNTWITTSVWSNISSYIVKESDY